MFSMIYLWLIGAVVLAGADILLGTIYLLIIAAAALAAFIFALIGAGILFQLLEFSIAEPSGMPNRKKVHRWFPAFGRSSG